MTDKTALAEALRAMVETASPYRGECQYCGAYGDETHKPSCAWERGRITIGAYDRKQEPANDPR